MRKDPGNCMMQEAGRHPACRRFVLLATTMLSAMLPPLAFPALAQTLPTGGSYVAGSGSIGSAGAAMTVTQSSTRGIIDWKGFGIGAKNSVQIDNGSGATLNRVTGNNLSQIDGGLNATGSVYLINPHGVVVGSGGKVLTGGSFVASTRDVPNDEFMAGGTMIFSGVPFLGGLVRNEGSITAQNGDVVLIGGNADNLGTISAPKGTAALAAGNEVVLSTVRGPAGIYVVPDMRIAGDASNSGTIRAAAALLASAGGNVYALAGNRGGIIQATGTGTIAGQVWLTAPNGGARITGTVTAANADGSGGHIVANGQAVEVEKTALLSASSSTGKGGAVWVGVDQIGQHPAKKVTIAPGAKILAIGVGNQGGFIETSGDALKLDGATIDAGEDGTWVIDPLTLTVTADTAKIIDASLDDGTNVTEQTTGGAGFAAGDINVDAAITWSSDATLTLSAFHSVNVNAAIIATGDGTLDIRTNNDIKGTSSGGSLNIALGKGDIQFTTQGEGALNIDGASYMLIWTMPELQAVGASGDYALATNIAAASFSGFAPIAENGFSGIFNGLGNTISNLVIDDPVDRYVGLFGQIGSDGVVQDIRLVGGSDTGNGTFVGVGTLAGENGGTIIDAEADGKVTAVGSLTKAGGLVGVNTGTIIGSGASGSVEGGHAYVGGLVGDNKGTIENSHADARVHGGDLAYVGGLAGDNEAGGVIRHSSATGDVSGGFGAEVGPLVGKNAGTIIP